MKLFIEAISLVIILSISVEGTTLAADRCPNTQDAAWIRCLRSQCAQSKAEPQIGMTTEQAEQSRWCFPDRRITTVTTIGKIEQWIYRRWQDYSKGGILTGVDGYLYFENDILTAIQRY